MAFQKLLSVADILMGENGCPWDQKQTYQSLRRSLLEETYEVLDALDKQDITHLTEELGDLLYNIVFLCKIGEKLGDFTIDDVCELIHDKLISRHPHIFGDKKAHTAEEVVELWEAVKKQENKKSNTLPKDFPALLRGFKLAKALKKKSTPTFSTEEELGQKLWELTIQAQTLKIDPESALRAHLEKEECSHLPKN